MRLTIAADKTSPYVRFTVEHHGLTCSMVDLGRWLDKRRAGTKEPRRQMADWLRHARAELRWLARAMEFAHDDPHHPRPGLDARR